jgi:hypothetical protein
MPVSRAYGHTCFLFTFCKVTATGARGGAVVEALRYKLEGLEIDSR